MGDIDLQPSCIAEQVVAQPCFIAVQPQLFAAPVVVRQVVVQQRAVVRVVQPGQSGGDGDTVAVILGLIMISMPLLGLIGFSLVSLFGKVAPSVASAGRTGLAATGQLFKTAAAHFYFWHIGDVEG